MYHVRNVQTRNKPSEESVNTVTTKIETEQLKARGWKVCKLGTAVYELPRSRNFKDIPSFVPYVITTLHQMLDCGRLKKRPYWKPQSRFWKCHLYRPSEPAYETLLSVNSRTIKLPPLQALGSSHLSYHTVPYMEKGKKQHADTYKIKYSLQRTFEEWDFLSEAARSILLQSTITAGR